MDRAGAIVVMGVTGAGKTTVGEALARELGWRYLDADTLHSAANIDKMSDGRPLDDADRAPWLAELNAVLRAAARDGTPVVLGCSALKRRYRKRLARGLSAIEFVYLHGSPTTLRARVSRRRDHFIDPALLDSQLATLEEPHRDEAIWVDLDQPVPSAVAEILSRVRAR